MTELIESPLRCLSYLELRAMVGDKIAFSREMSALGYHLRVNFRVPDNFDPIYLHDDMATDVLIAMTALREEIKGERTPPGILTELRDSSVGRIIDEMEKRSDAVGAAIGLELLKLTSTTARDLSRHMHKLASDAAKDLKNHDVTSVLVE
jgi:hypothetical protein